MIFNTRIDNYYKHRLLLFETQFILLSCVKHKVDHLLKIEFANYSQKSYSKYENFIHFSCHIRGISSLGVVILSSKSLLVRRQTPNYGCRFPIHIKFTKLRW